MGRGPRGERATARSIYTTLRDGSSYSTDPHANSKPTHVFKKTSDMFFRPTQRSLLYHYGAVALFGGALASGFAYFAIYRPVRGLVRHTAPEEAVPPPRS